MGELSSGNTHEFYSFEKYEPSCAIIILGHFCKRVAICVSFLEQDIAGETRALKIFNGLQTLSLISLWQEYCTSQDFCIIIKESIIPHARRAPSNHENNQYFSSPLMGED